MNYDVLEESNNAINNLQEKAWANHREKYVEAKAYGDALRQERESIAYNIKHATSEEDIKQAQDELTKIINDCQDFIDNFSASLAPVEETKPMVIETPKMETPEMEIPKIDMPDLAVTTDESSKVSVETPAQVSEINESTPTVVPTINQNVESIQNDDDDFNVDELLKVLNDSDEEKPEDTKGDLDTNAINAFLNNVTPTA